MYLFDHLNKMSKLLIHGPLAVPCGKRQVAGVDEVFWCRLHFLFFFLLVLLKVQPHGAILLFLQNG
jgi:hypothetical protein